MKNFIACEPRIGNGIGWTTSSSTTARWLKNGHITLPDKPGLGIELNPDVVKAHLAKGETWWGD